MMLNESAPLASPLCIVVDAVQNFASVEVERTVAEWPSMVTAGAWINSFARNDTVTTVPILPTVVGESLDAAVIVLKVGAVLSNTTLMSVLLAVDWNVVVAELLVSLGYPTLNVMAPSVHAVAEVVEYVQNVAELVPV